MPVEPAVDLVIPIHATTRPIARTVASVLDGAVPGQVRITVVCHNLAVEAISAVIPERYRDQVRFSALADGESSPAGPVMHGFRLATAPYVARLDSDDHLEPGALDAWLRASQGGRAAAVIAPERHASGARIRTPPVRWSWRGPADAVKDRLAYRTAPLGLIRREAIDRLGLDMSPRYRTGEDQLFGLKLWFSGETIIVPRRVPAYVVGDDAEGRVTTASMTPDIEFAAIRDLIRDPWFVAQPLAVRRAIATKLVRVHVFPAVSRRATPELWRSGVAGYFATLLEELVAAAPGFRRSLSLADERLVDALLDPAWSVDAVRRLGIARRRFGHPATVLTRDPAAMLAVDSPARFMVSSALV